MAPSPRGTVQKTRAQGSSKPASGRSYDLGAAGAAAKSTPPQPSSLAEDQASTSSDEPSEPQHPPEPAPHETFQSSLSYAQVRDFAYPSNVNMHYGPPPPSSAPESGTSTPPFEAQMRMEELPKFGADPAHQSWAAGAWAAGNEQLPQIAYSGDPDDHGPPYSEDEDLHSPVVVSARHRKYPGQTHSPGFDHHRAFFTGVNGDGSETYYRGAMDEMADGPGGELVTYDTDDPRHSSSALHSPDIDRRNQRRLDPTTSRVSDASRYSRDYQFSIASPDEEMHGKAVALFDFERENENELPLVEGQVIWVSYRHGQGWLVAEDPRTRESGLVPEEYVRLLRDIEGGLHSLSGDVAGAGAGAESDDMSPVVDGPAEAAVPVPLPPPTAAAAAAAAAATTTHHRGSSSNGGGGENNKPPVISTFSTSSKDLERYPHPLRGSETGQHPPQIVHYGGGGGGGGGGSGHNSTGLPSPEDGRKENPLETTLGEGGNDEEESNGKAPTKATPTTTTTKKDVKRSGSHRASKDPTTTTTTKRDTSRSNNNNNNKGKRSSLR